MIQVIRNSRLQDCEFTGRDSQTGRYIVREQLQPEAREFVEHTFDTEAEALSWLERLADA